MQPSPGCQDPVFLSLRRDGSPLGHQGAPQGVRHRRPGEAAVLRGAVVQESAGAGGRAGGEGGVPEAAGGHAQHLPPSPHQESGQAAGVLCKPVTWFPPDKVGSGDCPGTAHYTHIYYTGVVCNG